MGQRTVFIFKAALSAPIDIDGKISVTHGLGPVGNNVFNVQYREIMGIGKVNNMQQLCHGAVGVGQFAEDTCRT